MRFGDVKYHLVLNSIGKGKRKWCGDRCLFNYDQLGSSANYCTDEVSLEITSQAIPSDRSDYERASGVATTISGRR
jgi:hypothetical protein